MSQKVTVDYQGISIEAQAICQTSIHSLCKIDKVLDRIHKNASNLETSIIKEYEAYLLNSKEKIKEKIQLFKSILEKYNKAKSYTSDSDFADYKQFMNFSDEVKRKSNEVKKTVNELTGSKLAIIEQMIEEKLLNVGKETYQALLNKLNGVVEISNDVLAKINEIDDISLREIAYNESIKNNKLNFDEIITNAKKAYDLLLGKQTIKAIEEYKNELNDRGISSKELEKAKSINEANAIANNAIIDETIRKETLKVIIKAIRDRGFFVDTKNNLKIDKNKNIVKLVAIKASGQIAEFEIYLNGKFMYHFDEYEGHACKKDIEPFLEDLKKIYDIDILHQEMTWENPDKIQTQKYQHINKNKGIY